LLCFARKRPRTAARSWRADGLALNRAPADLDTAVQSCARGLAPPPRTAQVRRRQQRWPRNFSPARRVGETELLTLSLELGSSARLLARQACGSRAKAVCEHLADGKPLASLALQCDTSIGAALLRLQACSARRRGWGVWWAGRQVRACVDGGRTWLPEPKATATRRDGPPGWPAGLLHSVPRPVCTAWSEGRRAELAVLALDQ